jgi:hypothetical protein
MRSQKQVREYRGRLALGLVLVFILATYGVYVLHPLGDAEFGTVRIVYGGASALLVTLVLFFGVGTWSRFLPQDEAGDKVETGKGEPQDANMVKIVPKSEDAPNQPETQKPQ